MNWLREHKNQVRSTIVGAIVLGTVSLGASGVYLYRQKLATEAMIADRYQESQDAGMSNSISGSSEQSDIIREKEQALEAEAAKIHLDTDEFVIWNGKKYKRNTYVKAILLMGIDRSDPMTETKELGEAGQADGVFLIAQDTARNQLKILMIPRDTITDITFVDEEGTVLGKGTEHLSLAFAYGDGMYESCAHMSEAVSDLLFGLPIDHYFASDIAVIRELNDVVGGVTVTVPMYGMEHAGEEFKAGEQVTLTGDLAEKFVRYRDTDIDNSALYRMNQQKEYITQYFAAVKETSKTDSQIVEKLFGLMEDHMVTDMTKDEYMKLALDTMTGEGLGTESFRILPGSGVTTDEFDEFHMSKSETIQTVLELFYRESN